MLRQGVQTLGPRALDLQLGPDQREALEDSRADWLQATNSMRSGTHSKRLVTLRGHLLDAGFQVRPGQRYVDHLLVLLSGEGPVSLPARSLEGQRGVSDLWKCGETDGTGVASLLDTPMTTAQLFSLVFHFFP